MCRKQEKYLPPKYRMNEIIQTKLSYSVIIQNLI